ncbi:endo-1,4-beta-xylanase [Evansella halocellulosilytica]|uniref:endo-1,4-beta-xylanase n=1 Tax=Evansella halocellulosilytica TaxID=2011013 RepID=UPI00211D0212|nr:endo-1,4-beta-xylanase [Evansella halocellulosilytica]
MTNSVSHSIPSLCDVYKDYFLIGAAVNQQTLQTEQNLIKKHFNSLTAENEMKFEHLQPAEGQFSFEYADKLVSFANDNGKKVRGHTLVWHNQTSDWLFTDSAGKTIDRETLLARMENHIGTVVRRYKEEVYCWDVVNEAVADHSQALLRDSNWLSIIGEDFIEKAFHFAHSANPEALLFYNDYNESDPDKSDKIFQLVCSLVEREVPIHGVGLQAHWNLYKPSYDEIRKAIEKYASLGLQLHITEMDVSAFEWNDRRTDLKEPLKEMLYLQAERYDQFFQIFREYKDHITSVTFWGVSDHYTWLNDFPVKGRRNWPFVLDHNGNPKPAFQRVCQVPGTSRIMSN